MPPIILFNSLPNDKFLDLSKFNAFADNKLNTNMTEKLKFSLGRLENILEKRRKCRLSAFSPFPNMFSKASFPKGVKSRDCVVKR